MYDFKAEWPLDTSIEWQLVSRKKLNEIIRAYNNYQKNDFDYYEAKKVLSMIEEGKQTIGNQDRGSNYMIELVDMESFVKANYSL